MTRNSINDFSMKAYRDILQYFHKTHSYVTFRDYESNAHKNNLIILRHDMDFSLEQALKMAAIEAEYGIQASYFFFFSSPFYNILDEKNITIPRKIKELGHEIGLHYDVNVMIKGGGDNAKELLNSQIRLLENISDSAISSIAMHNPSTNGIDIFRETSYLNVYDDKFIRGMDYYSDSCMAWRNSFIEKLTSNTFRSKIQLLIHPILWSVDVQTRWEKLDQFIAGIESEIKKKGDIIRNIWKNHPGQIEHELRELKLRPDSM